MNKEAKKRAAKKACLTGEPAKGVEILADLYIDTNDPTYIFNQGRCFEQNNRYDDAITSFREYLRKAKNASQVDRDDAEKHIADCQTVQKTVTTEKTEAAKLATNQPATSLVSNAPLLITMPPFAPQPAGAFVAQSPSTSDQPTSGSGLRIASIVTATVGAAGLITGTVLNLKYNSTNNDLRAHYNANTDSSNQTTKTLAMVSYGIGAVCVAGGAILYYLGWSKGRATVVPASVASGLGAFLNGVF
jgi:hypothetical protein